MKYIRVGNLHPTHGLLAYVISLAAIWGAFFVSKRVGVKTLFLGESVGTSLPVFQPVAAGLFAVALTTAFFGYYILIRCFTSRFDADDYRRSTGIAIFLIILFGTIPPFLDADLFAYYQQGWLYVEHGESPYLEAPETFPGFPLEGWMGSNGSATSPYGPLWTWVESFVVLFCAGSLLTSVLVFKLIGVLTCTVLVLVATSFAREIGASRSKTAILVGANPLLLIEGSGMAHNDMLAILIVVSGFLLLAKKPRSIQGIVVSACANLVKATALPALLVVLFWAIRDGSGPGIIKSVLAATISLAVAIPVGFVFVDDLDKWPLLFGAANTSIYEIPLIPVNFLSTWLVEHWPLTEFDFTKTQVKGYVQLVLVALIGSMLLKMLLHADGLKGHLSVAGPGYFLASLLLHYWRPWYALWPAAMLVSEPSRRWVWLISAYSFLSLATNLITRSSGVSWG